MYFLLQQIYINQIHKYLLINFLASTIEKKMYLFHEISYAGFIQSQVFVFENKIFVLFMLGEGEFVS